MATVFIILLVSRCIDGIVDDGYDRIGSIEIGRLRARLV